MVITSLVIAVQVLISDNTKPADASFFLGSTTDEVLTAMKHAPDKITNTVNGQEWQYKSPNSKYTHDSIEFYNGKVYQYENSHGQLKLSNFREPNQTFWLGDSTSKVLVSNGAPTRVFRTGNGTNATFYYRASTGYQSSEIEIKNNKVVQYSNAAENLSLPTRDPLFPAFGVGASETEVLKAMGAPKSIHVSRPGESTWYYKSKGYRSNEVNFDDARVSTWQDYDQSLSISFTGASTKVSSTAQKTGVDLGDSLSDVLAVMGTPSGIEWITYKRPYDYVLTYRDGNRTSTVTIGTKLDGNSYKTSKVTAYDNDGGLLLISLTPNGLKLAADLLDSQKQSEPSYSTRVPTIDFEREARRYSIYRKPELSDTISSAFFSGTAPLQAENGSYYGEISKITFQPKTVFVRSYFRRDGTYVQSHFRSKAK